MKKVIGFFAIALLLSATILTPTADAFENAFEGICYKLGRGVSNVVLSPFELGISVDDKVNEYGISAGIPIGVLHGLGRGVSRIVTGAYDVVTFLFPMPTYNSYYMEPEFVLADPR